MAVSPFRHSSLECRVDSSSQLVLAVDAFQWGASIGDQIGAWSNGSLLCDGFGRNEQSEVNARAAVTAASRLFPGSNSGPNWSGVHQSVRAADPLGKGASTFAGINFVCRKGDSDYWEVHWLGDTRVGRWTEGSVGIEVLTVDHTMAETLRRSGQEVLLGSVLEHALTAYLGHEMSPEPARLEIEVPAGSTLLLMSDGFHRKVEEVVLSRAIGESRKFSYTSAIEPLLSSPYDDDATLVLVRPVLVGVVPCK